MKKFLFALTSIAVLQISLAARGEADPELLANFFYDNLAGQGNWIEVGDYGYCFQPNVAVNDPNWRPYADGYWAYTDVGWTWVSYEDFGWATYHYGRWMNLDDYGWLWVPGYEWAPAWVSWRAGGDYVGWAPLPPVLDPIYEGSDLTGQVDLQLDIGPVFYNFVEVRYLGEPVLRGRIFAPSENISIINRTVNVTRITRKDSIVYNYGPSYDRVNRYSNRPIQRLTLQREGSIGAQDGGHRNFSRVSGDRLLVVAPSLEKPAQPSRPKQVQARVPQPKIERGWRGVENRPQLQAQMKQENASNVPPPSFQPRKDRPLGAARPATKAKTQPNEQRSQSQPIPAAPPAHARSLDDAPGSRRLPGRRPGQTRPVRPAPNEELSPPQKAARPNPVDAAGPRP